MKTKTVYGVRIIDLAGIVKFKEVKRAMKFHYPKTNKSSMGRYEEIMKEMSKYPIKANQDKDEQLVIEMCPANSWFNSNTEEWVEDTKIGEEYYSTNMRKKGEKYTYAIEFTRWEVAANWVIAKDTLERYTSAEILAHFIWEMTFCGYTQAPIQRKMKSLEKIGDEIKSGKAKCVPYTGLDDLLKKGKKKK